MTRTAPQALVFCEGRVVDDMGFTIINNLETRNLYQVHLIMHPFLL